MKLLVIFVNVLCIWNTHSAIFPDKKTEAYCAIAKSFHPTPEMFLSIIDYCNQTLVPSLSCNISGNCGLSINVINNLDVIDLNSNQLSGTIPTQFGYLTNLTQIYLYYNQLSGTIPTQFGYLTSLIYLYLSSNQLSGIIPTQLGYMTNLAQFLIHEYFYY